MVQKVNVEHCYFIGFLNAILHHSFTKPATYVLWLGSGSHAGIEGLLETRLAAAVERHLQAKLGVLHRTCRADARAGT
jgi:hypothetical protein